MQIHSRLEPDVLHRLQAARAAAHAKFAMTHTTFYREHYGAAGFRPSDLDDPAAFGELPLVEKADVRARNADFVSTEANERTSKRSVTGGSTGEPLTLLRDLRFPARALEWRLMDWWGVSPADDVALVSRHVKTAQESRRHQLQWWPSRRFQLDAFAMTESSVTAFLERWQRIRPALLIGYVGAITEVAGMVVQGRVPRPHPPKAIAVTAAPLNLNQRQLIQAAFNAPVYDHYRSAEVPWIAGECQYQDGLHVFSDVRTLEVVDDDGRATAGAVAGEVVVSDLTNRVFPLLRYRIGDRGRYLDHPCPCGVTLPLIGTVAGRTSEVLHLPNGQSVAGEGLAQIFSLTPEAVRQFQIHQRSDYSIDVSVVLNDVPDARRAAEDGVARFRRVLREAVPVRLCTVDVIPHDGGKVRYLVSDLEPAARKAAGS
jgi:phenylacetate-CoA ligase